MQATRLREVHSSLSGFQREMTLVSYVPKQNRAVMLLSSLHHDDYIHETENLNPQIIVDYNAHKSGVDTLDQLVRCYSLNQKINLWPFALFCNLLDNAFVLFLDGNSDVQSQTSHRRRIFWLT